MEKFFKGKYRVQSARWKDWDYSYRGYYFVTICTKNKELFFGDIANRKMLLSSYGKIADDFWKKIPKHFNNVILDEFIVMPNHIHGILIINDNNENPTVETRHGENPTVETRHGASLRGWERRRFGPLQKNSLSVVVNHFKGAVTKKINKNFSKNYFAWQQRFHDRVIRSERELSNIRYYIFNNPEKWEMDRNNFNKKL